jgi:hypothetical protein
MEYVSGVYILLILYMIYIKHIQEYSTLILAYDRRDPQLVGSDLFYA